MTRRRAKEADIAHGFHRDQIKSFLPTVITFGSEALKVTMVLNGAAAAAVLAYIGTGRQDVPVSMITAMEAFGVGLLSGAAAHASSYLAQYAYHANQYKQHQTWEHPYLKETDASKRWLYSGWCFHIITVALVLFSLLAAGYGFASAASALKPMIGHQRSPDMSTTTPGNR